MRLGGHEAPPAIISVFVGELEDLVDRLLQGVTAETRHRDIINLGGLVFPTLRKDRSDRNRTSPFAFTGNKFEFRMVGSSASIATPNTVLNTITAEMLSRIADETESLVAKGEDNKVALKKVIIEYLSRHRRVIYNGNNYSEEWYKEAKERGLENITNCVDAYKALLRDKNVEVYSRQGVLSREEVESRYEIYLDNYAKTINIEATTMLMMARTQLLPNFTRYATELASGVVALKGAGVNGKSQIKLLGEYQKLLDKFSLAIDKLVKAIDKAHDTHDELKKAENYRDTVVPSMEKVRKYADKLETITDRNCYGMPTYSDIMFYN